MIVNAALAFWNERPEDLRRCVIGIANIADRIVAVDGAYARYPGATIRSPDVQIEALRTAADERNIELRLIQPDRLWAGQVEKREFMMRDAMSDADWVALVDADWVIYTDKRKA